MVITTFQTLASEHKTHAESSKPPSDDSDSDSDSFGKKTLRKKKGKASPAALFGVKWLRVVIGESMLSCVAMLITDEAQNIKNKGTQAAKAAVALEAKYRWCLTGTPIQVSSFQSLHL